MIRDDIKAAQITAMKAGDKEARGAISLIQAVLKDHPEFLDGRKLLRKVEIQLAGGSAACLVAQRCRTIPTTAIRSAAA